MIEAEASVVINRPVNEVFSFVTDPRNEPKWHTDVVEAAPPSDGELRKGSRFRWTVKLMGRKQQDLEVTAFDPGRREQFRALNGPMLPTVTYTFEPSAGGTRFTRRVEVEPRGMFRMMGGMMGGMVSKRNRRFLENLKRVLEG